MIKSTQDAVHKMVEEKISECSNWQQVHKVCSISHKIFDK